MKLGGSPLKSGFLKRKMRFVMDVMEEQEMDMWLTFTREGNEDPLAEDLRLGDLTWRSAGIIEKDGSGLLLWGASKSSW
jgi:hypothetical protein